MRHTISLLLGLGLLTPLTAFASSGHPVSKQKNVELNSVAENQGNYDSPPVSPPRMYSVPGYSECLDALGSTYCRQNAHWLLIER